MRKQLTRSILVTGTVAAALCLGVPAAFAVTTWTVSGGTNFTAVQSSGTTFTLSDTTAGSGFTCTVATAAGTVKDEMGGTNTAIGSVTSSTFGSSTHKCNGTGGAAGVTGTSTQKSGTTATLNVSSFSGGVTTGTITNIDEVETAAGGLCTITVTGTAGVKYTNSSSLLQFTTAGDSLSVASTSGICPGVSKGDTVTFSSGTGGETVTGSPVNPIQVSSP